EAEQRRDEVLEMGIEAERVTRVATVETAAQRRENRLARPDAVVVEPKGEGSGRAHTYRSLRCALPGVRPGHTSVRTVGPTRSSSSPKVRERAGRIPIAPPGVPALASAPGSRRGRRRADTRRPRPRGPPHRA